MLIALFTFIYVDMIDDMQLEFSTFSTMDKSIIIMSRYKRRRKQQTFAAHTLPHLGDEGSQIRIVESLLLLGCLPLL